MDPHVINTSKLQLRISQNGHGTHPVPTAISSTAATRLPRRRSTPTPAPISSVTAGVNAFRIWMKLMDRCMYAALP